MKCKLLIPCLVLLSIYGCSKDSIDIHNSDNNHLNSSSFSNITHDLGHQNVSFFTAPSRKAIQYTKTDLETGKTETFWDCTEPGHTCDIGDPEIPKNPPQQGKEVNNLRRNAVIELLNTNNKLDHTSLKKLSNYFPILTSEIIGKIKQDLYSVRYDKNYFAVLDMSNNNVVMVYNMSNDKLFNTMAVPDSTGAVYKKGSFNTEKNILECIEDGTNCLVSKPIEEEVDYLNLGINAFGKFAADMNIHNYSHVEIFETKNYLEFSVRNNNAKFFVKK